jgi:hypothetical protein
LTKQLKYTDQIDPAWSETAVDRFQVTPRPDAVDPVMLELNGSCPRCGHPMQHTEQLIAFRGVTTTSVDALRAAVKTLRDTGVMTESLLPVEFSIRCGCPVKHPDPLGRSGVSGCGAIWKMRIETVEDKK